MKSKTIKLTFAGIVRAKKNSKTIAKINGHSAIISNPKARAMEQEMVRQFQDQLKAQGKTDIFWVDRFALTVAAKQAGTKYAIKMRIFQPDNIRRDLDNQATSLLDGLSAAGAIVDDCRQFVKSLTIEDGGIDKAEPRAEIEITETAD